jgi:hypothetical protein
VSERANDALWRTTRCGCAIGDLISRSRLHTDCQSVSSRSPRAHHRLKGRLQASKQRSPRSTQVLSTRSHILIHIDIEIDGRGALRRTDGHGPPCGGALAEAVVRTSIVFFLQISPNALARDWWRKVVIASTRDRWAPRGTRHTTCMRSSWSIAIEHELEYESVRSNRCPQQSSSGGQRDHG